MTDVWIPRLYVLGQVVIVAVCGAMICLGHDSTVTDLFLAAGGGLVATQGWRIVSKQG